ncbi:4972_t:CDS:2 [Gigaspora margarita]|uniref:4972_t:CDS:1 n=1 Tax=Gigaspora margarita TaxID=4874 RepID=A0ABN7VN26_GIGMA|nr:4972_t:CDS:2 [Gigaspora margarita]
MLKNMPGVNDIASMDITRGHLLDLLDYDTFCAIYHLMGDIYSNSNYKTPLPPTIIAIIKDNIFEKEDLIDFGMKNQNIQDVQTNPFKSPDSRDSLANIKDCNSNEISPES